jgi:hypothetical protein
MAASSPSRSWAHTHSHGTGVWSATRSGGQPAALMPIKLLPYWLTMPSPWPGPRPGRSLGRPVRPRPPLTPTWQARRRRGRRRSGPGIAGGKHNERRCAGGQLPFGPAPLHHGSGDSSAYSPSSGYLPRRTCPYHNHIEDVFTGHGTLHARYGGRFLIPGSGRGARAMAVRLEATAQVRAPPVRFGEVFFCCGVAYPIGLAPRSVGSAHGDSFDPRTQPGDAADWGEGPVGVDSELVDRAGGADFVVEVLPVR